MRKSLSDNSNQQAKGSATKAKASAAENACLIGSVVCFFLGLCDVGHEGDALLWRVRAKLFYVEGLARVEKAEVVPFETDHTLQVTYHLEVNGKQYPSVVRVARDNPETTQEMAEKRRTRFTPGQLYRCWYQADRPEASELAPDGLELGMHVLLLGIPLGFFALGWALYRAGARRWKARGGGAQTPTEED